MYLYLDANPDICMKRVQERKRPGESVNSAYLYDLAEAYEHMILNWDKVNDSSGNEPVRIPADKPMEWVTQQVWYRIMIYLMEARLMTFYVANPNPITFDD